MHEPLTENEQHALAELEALSERSVMSHREIGKRLGISHATSENIERRALQKMRKLLRNEWK